VAKIDRDGAIAFLPFDAEQATPYVERMTEDEIEASWQWMDPDGTRLMKTPAAMRLLESLGWSRPIARLLSIAGLQWLVGIANAFFNSIRGPAGRFVPDVDRTIRWP